MIEFNSKWAEFKPLNPNSPEDLEKLKQHMQTALNFRNEPLVETQGCIVIHYDEFGMFSKPVSNKYIILIVEKDEEDCKRRRYEWFIKRFVDRYFKTGGKNVKGRYCNSENYDGLSKSNYEYDSVIYMLEDFTISKELNLKTEYNGLAIDSKNRPVFFFETMALDDMERRPEEDKERLALETMARVWQHYQDSILQRAALPAKKEVEENYIEF